MNFFPSVRWYRDSTPYSTNSFPAAKEEGGEKQKGRLQGRHGLLPFGPLSQDGLFAPRFKEARK